MADVLCCIRKKQRLDDAGYSSPIETVSLYGETEDSLHPDPEKLKDIDVLIFDIQDIGVRYYTYISTMALIMEAASEIGVPLLILDRLNPLGDEVDGPLLNIEYSSFVGMYPIPIRHGMSIGELAKMIKGSFVSSISIKVIILLLSNISLKSRCATLCDKSALSLLNKSRIIVLFFTCFIL